MPPNRVSNEASGPLRPHDARHTPRREPGARRRVTLVTAVQDVQRKRRARRPLRRIATIVPVTDYRDVVG
jgi:hypothetical protein